jgi:hypothetical protein
MKAFFNYTINFVIISWVSATNQKILVVKRLAIRRTTQSRISHTQVQN